MVAAEGSVLVWVGVVMEVMTALVIVDIVIADSGEASLGNVTINNGRVGKLELE